MSAHFEELVITTLGEIKESIGGLENKVESLDHRLGSVENRLGSLEIKVDSLDRRMGAVENRTDRLENMVFDIKELLPTFATKQELREMEGRIMDTLEVHTGILQRLDQDRYAEKQRMDRLEVGLNETRVHVGLRPLE